MINFVLFIVGDLSLDLKNEVLAFSAYHSLPATISDAVCFFYNLKIKSISSFI